MEGYVKTVNVKGFGFISVKGQPDDFFFHSSQLQDDLEFGEQLRGRRVTFTVVHSDRGPKAMEVRGVD